MTIKDAEKLTGLTMKSIRFYEEKGLIQVERNKDNDYRKYTEEDIEKLKLIKILRYINFSIEDIFSIFKENNLEDSLKEKIKQLELESTDYLEKQTICESLLKDCKKKKFDKLVDEYNETIVFLESEEGKESKNELLRALCPNLSSIIVQSIIYIAPILWLFYNISIEKWEVMFLNSIFAIISAILLTIEWNYYFSFRKQFKEMARDKDKNNILSIPVGIVAIIISVCTYIFLNYLVQLLGPKDYLFFETAAVPTKIMAYGVTLLIIVLLCLILKKIKINKTEDLDDYLYLFNKFKYFVIIIYIIISYCFVTSVTFVTEDKIIYKDPFHPFGISYNYSDITKIETGYGNKSISFVDYKLKGQFYYRIYFGKRNFTFSVSLPNENIKRYQEDSYLELEEFDNKLKEYKIEKITDNKYASLCDFDKIYCDRFNRITDKN